VHGLRINLCLCYVVKVQSDILMSMVQREVTLPVPLDLSAAYDTMDHEIMLEILKSNFCVGGNALGWIKYFLSDSLFL
jgi:hypothetical protein